MSRLGAFVPLGLWPKRTIVAAAAASIAAERFAQADRLLERGLRRHGEDFQLLEQYATSAHNSARYEEARERWDRLRGLRPDHAMAWAGIACNLRELGRCAEALPVAFEALSRFPTDAIVTSEACRLLAALDDDDARRRLAAALCEAAPADAADILSLLDALASLDERDEAATLIEKTRETSPPVSELSVPDVAIAPDDGDPHRTPDPADPSADDTSNAEFDRLAAEGAALRIGKPDAALRALDLALAHQPDNVAWIAWRAEALIMLGRLDDAGDALASAKRRFPEPGPLDPACANLAGKRELWDEAIDLLETHLSRFPSDEHARNLRANIQAERNYTRDEPAPTPRRVLAPQDVGVEDDAAKRALLLGFESLGENCEFGLVQRRYGAEPVGLFRWNSTRVEALVAAIEAGLDGFGSEEHTLMSIWDDVEYYLADRRWGFGFHTFTNKNEVAQEVLYRKMCRRLAYLREKFLEDMRTGSKAFVLRSETVTHDQLLTLQAALSCPAPARLICVKQRARAPDPSAVSGGDVFAIGERLYLGYVDRFGHDGIRWDIVFDDWIAICRDHAGAGVPPFSPADL